MAERLEYKGHVIHYEITIKKVKNINLRIRNDGLVQLSVSKRVGRLAAEQFLLCKADWVIRALKYHQEKAAQKDSRPEPRDYLSGETFLLLGEECMLEVRPGEKNMTKLEGNQLLLEVAQYESKQARKQVFDSWYTQYCREVFTQVMERVFVLFAQTGIQKPSLTLRFMKSRWGSCTPAKRKVTLNKHLLKAPVCCIEYVAAHEITHLLHPNHSKDFYSELSKKFPQYDKAKNLLHKQNIL